jgi:hypothetical protein
MSAPEDTPSGRLTTMASQATVAAMEDFVRAVPEVEPEWREHLEANGEVLPHVFFGDVSRFAVKVAEGSDVELATRFSAAIEKLAASENPEVVNVIHVSFAENLAWGDQQEQRALAELKNVFGPMTLRRIAEFEDWASKAAGSEADSTA